MKNKLYAIFLLSIILISGCKKGDEDPFLSIYSREKRLCGEWKVVSFDYQYTEHICQLLTYQRIMNCKNGSYTSTVFFNEHKSSYSGTYTYFFKIDKKGSYRKEECFNYKIPYDTTMQRIEEGNWYFMNKNKTEGFKNKEVVAFQPTSIVYSPVENYNFKNYQLGLFKVIELKNKEIKLNEHTAKLKIA